MSMIKTGNCYYASHNFISNTLNHFKIANLPFIGYAAITEVYNSIIENKIHYVKSRFPSFLPQADGN